MNAATPDTAPDFRHVRYWVFDLDHTLYTTDAETQKALEERICRYVQATLDLPRDPAWDVQKRYLMEHGSTLAGLVRHHGVDPDHYHDAINDITELNLTKDDGFRKALARLAGKRFVFTNNCGRFAANVLAGLGVEDLFDGIVDARILMATPKPSPASFDALISRGDIDPTAAAMFDDSVRNLAAAKSRGMKTVWFNTGGGFSSWKVDDAHLHIDHETDDLAAFLNRIRI
jgi:putative hydrolase of the HAD superfamily